MIYDEKQLKNFENVLSKDKNASQQCEETKEESAKYEVEQKFGKTNYSKDQYLKKRANKDGWIDIDDVNKMPKMKSFKIPQKRLFEILKDSAVVEVMKDEGGYGSGYFVRQREHAVNIEALGFDVESIKDLTKQ